MSQDQAEWFQEELSYEGAGVFQYHDPTGRFTGDTTVRVGSDGRVDMKMKEPDIDTGDEEFPGALPFFFGKRIESESGKKAWGIGGGHANVCDCALIETIGGNLSTVKPVIATDVDGGKIDFVQSAVRSLSIEPTICTYEAKGSQSPKYWIIPLINFLGINFRMNQSEFSDHPLRLHTGRGLCPFLYKDRPAFIEAVAQYDDRRQSLIGGREEYALTAVMVGEVCDDEDVSLGDKASAPAKLLSALHIVSGTWVGAPWIEYRDEQGDLVSRWHGRLSPFPFDRVHEIVHDWGLSHLMTRASKSLSKMDSHFHFSVSTLLHSLSNIVIIDNSFALICASIESLCNRAGILEDDLSASLQEDTRLEALDILRKGAKALVTCSVRAQKHGDSGDAHILKVISDRVRSASNRSGKLGRRVEKLLEHYALKDLELIGEKFEKRYGQPWFERMAYFRSTGVHGQVMHDWDSEFREMWVMLRHLQDIVVRILLITLDYDGEYNPITFVGTGAEKTGWVTDRIRLDSLGYDLA